MLSLGKLASRLGKSFRRNYESNFILSMRTMKPVESLEDCHNTVRSGSMSNNSLNFCCRSMNLVKMKLFSHSWMDSNHGPNSNFRGEM